MLKVTRWSHDPRWFSLTTATTALLTYVVCLAAGVEGKRPQTEKSGLGTQYQLCLLEGGVSWMPSQYTFQEGRQKKKKKLSTKRECERGAAWWSSIKLRFEGRKQTRTWRAADERNQNTWTTTARLVQLVQYTAHVKTGGVKTRSESETLITVFKQTHITCSKLSTLHFSASLQWLPTILGDVTRQIEGKYPTPPSVRNIENMKTSLKSIHSFFNFLFTDSHRQANDRWHITSSLGGHNNTTFNHGIKKHTHTHTKKPQLDGGKSHLSVSSSHFAKSLLTLNRWTEWWQWVAEEPLPVKSTNGPELPVLNKGSKLLKGLQLLEWRDGIRMEWQMLWNRWH